MIYLTAIIDSYFDLMIVVKYLIRCHYVYRQYALL